MAALPAALMHSLGFHFDKESLPLQQLREQLSSQHRLLILDNFEHLLRGEDGLDIIPQLLQSAPHIKVRLNIQGEHIMPLGGIAYPDTAQLFVQCAQQAVPAFTANAADQAAIARICQQVDGSPLGILLAAGWSRLLSPTAIAAQLAASTETDFLVAERGDLPARHRSLRAVFDYSWNLLKPSEQAALAGLSLFPSSFMLDAAQAIGNTRLRELGVLVDHSLVQKTAVNRYHLHEITRQFARKKTADRAALQTQYCRYYASQLAHWAAKIQGEGQLDAIQMLDMEIDNGRLAWDWIVEQGHHPLIEQALDGLCLYYDWRHRYPEGYETCQLLVERLEARSELVEVQSSTGSDLTAISDWNQSEINQMMAKGLTWQSIFAPTEQTEALLRRGLACLDDPATDPASSQWERAFCLFQLAGIISAAGDTDSGLEMYTRSIEIYETLGDRWALANVLTPLGELLWNLSAYEEAAEVLDRNLTIYRELRDQRGMATVMVWLSAALLGQGKREGERLLGEQLLKEGLALYASLGYQVSMTDGFYQAIAALLILGQYVEARALLEERNAQEKGSGLRQDVTHTLLADTLIFLGEYDAARPLVQAGLELAQQGGDVYVLAIALADNGWLALADGAYDSARDWFQEAADHCREHDLKEPLSWALSFLGFAYWQLDELETAVKNFVQSLTIASEIESFMGAVFALVSGIPLIAEFESKEMALMCYAAASDYPILSNAPLFDDLLGEQVAAIKADLSPEAVAEAEVRGREVGLEGMVIELWGGDWLRGKRPFISYLTQQFQLIKAWITRPMNILR